MRTRLARCWAIVSLLICPNVVGHTTCEVKESNSRLAERAENGGRISMIEYDVVKPSGTPQCLIFSVHGAGQSGGNHEANLRMNPVGTARQCIVVTPTNRIGIFGIFVWPFWLNEYANNAMYKMVRSFQTLYDIPPKKTFFTGFSQGAWMTWWMWLNYPQSFGGFVAISGGINGLLGPHLPDPLSGDGRPVSERAIEKQRDCFPRLTPTSPPPMWLIGSIMDGVLWNLMDTAVWMKRSDLGKMSFSLHDGHLSAMDGEILGGYLQKLGPSGELVSRTNTNTNSTRIRDVLIRGHCYAQNLSMSDNTDLLKSNLPWSLKCGENWQVINEWPEENNRLDTNKQLAANIMDFLEGNKRRMEYKSES